MLDVAEGEAAAAAAVSRGRSGPVRARQSADEALISPSALVLRSELLGSDTLAVPSGISASLASESARRTSEGPVQPRNPRVRRRVGAPVLSPPRGVLGYGGHDEGTPPASPRRPPRGARRSLASPAAVASATMAVPPPDLPSPGSAYPGSPRRRSGRAAALSPAAGSLEADVDAVSAHGLGALSAGSRALVGAPRPAWRRVSKVPYKVLDAPALMDDFYVTLVDWSARDTLAVGLGPDLFLWDAKTAMVRKLCNTARRGRPDSTIAAVSWSESGRRVAMSMSSGTVEVWDADTSSKVRTIPEHPSRVGCMAWSNNVLATGCRDGKVRLFDVRQRGRKIASISAHGSEVCGLAFSPDRTTLASGGNDNNVGLWATAGAARRPGNEIAPLYTLKGHRAAVKALAWSPHKRGLLVSGGGTMDKCLRFWSSIDGRCVGCVDTGCQVCNVRWSLSADELVTTHGYSHNDVVVWRYPSMARVATLTGHKARVLFLAMDPSGQNVVTGAGDETLRFWRAFPPMTEAQREARPEHMLPAEPSQLEKQEAVAMGTPLRTGRGADAMRGEVCR